MLQYKQMVWTDAFEDPFGNFSAHLEVDLVPAQSELRRPLGGGRIPACKRVGRVACIYYFVWDLSDVAVVSANGLSAHKPNKTRQPGWPLIP